MARIPDNRDLGIATTGSVVDVATLDTSDVGQGLKEVAGALRENMSERSRYAESKANSQFLIEMEKQERQLDDDNEYGTHDQRFSTSMEASLGELSKTIDDPAMRQNFIDRQKLALERGRTRVQDGAWNKEVDHERADVEQFLDDARGAAIESGDWDSYVETVGQRIKDAADVGYYSQEEAGEVTRRWTDDAAVGYLETLDPSRRIEILSDAEGPAGGLDGDVRSKLLEQARNEYADTEAQALVDGYMDQGMGITDMMQSTAGIQDDVLRKKTEDRFILQHGRENAARAEQQMETFDDNYIKIRSGEMRVDDLEPGIMESLTASQVNSMYAAEGQATNDRSFDDQTLLDQLYVLQAQDTPEAWNEARQAIMNNAHLLTRDTYDKWSKATAEGVSAPVEIKSLFSAKQQVRQLAGEAGVNKDSDVFKIENKLDSWFQGYQEQNGKAPDEKAITEHIDYLLMEVPREGFTADRRVYDYQDRNVGGTSEEDITKYTATLQSLKGGEGLTAENLGTLADYEDLTPSFVNHIVDVFESEFGEKPNWEELKGSIDDSLASATPGRPGRRRSR